MTDDKRIFPIAVNTSSPAGATTAPFRLLPGEKAKELDDSLPHPEHLHKAQVPSYFAEPLALGGAGEGEPFSLYALKDAMYEAVRSQAEELLILLEDLSMAQGLGDYYESQAQFFDRQVVLMTHQAQEIHTALHNLFVENMERFAGLFFPIEVKSR